MIQGEYAMASKRLHRFAHVLLAALVLSAPAFADVAVTVSIDGAAYPAQLRENTELLSRIRAVRSAHAIHYEGELTGVADSWIRVSNIRGRWQGVVSRGGSRFVIDSRARAGGGAMVLDAQAPTDILGPSYCATESPAASTTPLAAELSSAAADATLPLLPCQSTVNGVCLLAELDIAFDLLFQSHYGADAQNQAAALLNIVDGFYRNDMNTQFDALSMTFLTTDLFSTTTDANAFLTDISTKKNANQVPFVTNPRAILHVVTGRDFATSTVGIANVGSLCSPTDNVGTSQIASNSIALTALIVAHEIGHNFGASHDGTGSNTCSATQFVMAATLNPNATHFSSCSITEMTTKVNSLLSPGACLEYPVDPSLAAHPGNPTTANANENVTLGYDLRHPCVANAALTVSGSFAAAGGTFVGATLNGNACSVAGDGQTYSCSTSCSAGDPGTTTDLIQATARIAGGTSMNVRASVATGTAGGTKDIDASNNTVALPVSTSTAPAAPSGLTAAVSGTTVNLAWQDNSGNEDGFRIERRVGSGAWSQIVATAANATAYSDTTGASGTTYEYRVSAFGPGGTSAPSPSATAAIAGAPVASGGGGGGGGSSGIELAALLCALFALRRRQPVAR
jgi:hypothetical protein